MSCAKPRTWHDRLNTSNARIEQCQTFKYGFIHISAQSSNRWLGSAVRVSLFLYSMFFCKLCWLYTYIYEKNSTRVSWSRDGPQLAICVWTSHYGETRKKASMDATFDPGVWARDLILGVVFVKLSDLFGRDTWHFVMYCVIVMFLRLWCEFKILWSPQAAIRLFLIILNYTFKFSNGDRIDFIL